MPQPKIAVNYQLCDPESCQDGVCAAAQVCQKKVLRQEKPYEMPDVYPSLCLGCIDCISQCPLDAIQIMR